MSQLESISTIQLLQQTVEVPPPSQFPDGVDEAPLVCQSQVPISTTALKTVEVSQFQSLDRVHDGVRPPAWSARRASSCTQRQAAGIPFSLTDTATAGSPFPVAPRSFPVRRGFVNPAGARPPTTTRVRVAAALQQRLQDKKEDAWELFQRQQSWRPKERDEFEKEYRRKVTRQPEHSPFGPDEREEKSLQELGGRVAQERSGGQNEGSQRKSEDGGRGHSLTKARGMVQTRGPPT